MSARSASTSKRAAESEGGGRRNAGVGSRDGRTANERAVRSVEDAREARLEEKQHELETVLERHDTLIREVFHLEKWRSLLSYNPAEAKKDHSDVFFQFKARWDLMAQTPETGVARRTTRNAHAQRVQLLTNHTQRASVIVPPRVAQRKKAEDPKRSDPDAIWSILASAKGKGKAVGVEELSPVFPLHDSKGKGRARAMEQLAPSASRPGPPEYSAARPSRRTYAKHNQKRATRPEITDSTVDFGATPPSASARLPPKKRLKTSHSVSALGLEGFADSNRPHASKLPKPPPAYDNQTESLSTALPRRSRRARAAEDLLTSIVDPGINKPGGLLAPEKSVTRVTLIVRPPQPTYSSPRQRPPTPKHGQSLGALLSSFTLLDDQEASIATLVEKANKDAAFWHHVDSMRRQGKLMLPVHLDDNIMPSTAMPNAFAQVGKPSDAWAYIVEEVTSRQRPREAHGIQVAAQVASKVKTYWDGQASKLDKLKAQEEKRLRSLAKVTIRIVVDEWKKAVYHIREKERERLEAEERRRGHEHLDAILDQSGQILEAQQYDLTKASSHSHSRSTSVSASLQHWASSPQPEDADSDSDDTERHDSDDDSDTDTGQEHNAGLSSLLLADDSTSFRQRSSTAGSVPSSAHIDQDEFLHENTPASSRDAMLSDGAQSMSPSLSFLPGQDDDFSEIRISEEQSEITSERSLSVLLSYRKSPSPLFPEVIPSFEDTEGTFSLLSAHQPSHPTDILPSLDNDPLSTLHDNASRSSTVQPEVDSIQVKNVLSPTLAASEDALLPETPLAYDAESMRLDVSEADDDDDDDPIPPYLRPFAIAPVEWDSDSKVKPPLLLRGSLRPYQQSGLEWLASLHSKNLNGILADEMGLGKTIQTIALLAHLACDRGIWGPHLIVVPTSVLLNWEMEFKKFLPGFKVLSYHGNTNRRKELRKGWNNKYHFNRKQWYYMILDEAHMIKNFKSQRWNTLLLFRSFRRLLLTGTPLQNNLTELWALLQFLMSGTDFANLKEFGDWFANPLEKAIEMGNIDSETQQRVNKLHTVLRPYLLRRLKRDVEKELPSKFEHLVMCPLSKRQRFLYDEFMARAETRHDLQSGVYQKIANILMQLRKVVNHPNLFEVRPIRTSFAMERSAIAGYEIKELLIRRRLVHATEEDSVDLDLLGLDLRSRQNKSTLTALLTRQLDASFHLSMITKLPGEPPPRDTRTVAGYKQFRAWQERAASVARWQHIGYINRLRCDQIPLYGEEIIARVQKLYEPLRPLQATATPYLSRVDRVHSAVLSYVERAELVADEVDRFAFATPAVVAKDMGSIALRGFEGRIREVLPSPDFDAILHQASLKLQIAFPDPSLLQYDCGKLQELDRLLRERKAGGHRILIFTQMTRILDLLEIFLNLHGYLYLRLDGATKIEDRQYITERFNSDQRIFCFISSSRSGGVGINLTGADTVIFYDSDFNPQMDRQCEDRAHRIGQIRDVHIYRFVSQHTIEEALLRKANQKRSLDDLVIQKGEFDWRTLFSDEVALTRALGEFEDVEDAHAAAVAASEESVLRGVDDADFEGADPSVSFRSLQELGPVGEEQAESEPPETPVVEEGQELEEQGEDDAEGGTTVDYMLAFVRSDMEFFGEWRL